MAYRILVVDDNKQTASFLADMLTLLGHNVTLALGSRGAIYRVKQVKPDVIFMDVNMPGVDGLEVCRYLRRDPATSVVPVVIVSANDEQSHKDAAIAAGANYYIVKPAMMEEVEKALGLVMSPTAPPNPGSPLS